MQLLWGVLQSPGTEAVAVTIIHVCSFLVVTPHNRNLLSPYYVPSRTWVTEGRALYLLLLGKPVTHLLTGAERQFIALRAPQGFLEGVARVFVLIQVLTIVTMCVRPTHQDTIPAGDVVVLRGSSEK